MKTRRINNTLIVDIHGMRAEAAKFRLESTINGCGKEVCEIIVIHGYNNGQALREMIRNDLASERIKDICADFANDGQTKIRLLTT